MPTKKNLIALIYTGARPHGVSIQMYRSYKVVDVTPTQPYFFTQKDNRKPEAYNYYERLAKLHIKPLVEGQEDQIPEIPDNRFIHKAPKTPFEKVIKDNADNNVPKAVSTPEESKPNEAVEESKPTPQPTTEPSYGKILLGEHPLIPETEELRVELDNKLKELAKTIDDADINMKGISDDQLTELMEPIFNPELVLVMSKYFNIGVSSRKSYPKMIAELVTNGNSTLVEYINMYRDPNKVAHD